MNEFDDSEKWDRLLMLGDLLAERAEQISGERARDRVADEVMFALDCALEAFPRSIEPVDDFPAFAVRRFAKALRDGLVRAQREGGEPTH